MLRFLTICLLAVIVGSGVGCGSSQEELPPVTSGDDFNDSDGVAGFEIQESAETAANAETEAAMPPPRAAEVVRVPAKQYYDEFHSDKEAFKQRYQGKVIELTGTAIDASFAHDNPYIKLDVGADEFTGVHCFTLEQQPWAIVSPGQVVTLRGKFPDLLFAAQLKDAQIVELGESPAPHVTAEEISAQLAASLDDTNAKYEDREVFVEGVVEEIEQDAVALILRGTNGVRVRCTLYEYAKAEQAPHVKVGDKVYLIGYYGRMFGKDEVSIGPSILWDPDKALASLEALANAEPVAAVPDAAPPAKPPEVRMVRVKVVKDEEPIPTPPRGKVLTQYPTDMQSANNGHLDSTGSGTWSYLSCDKLNPTAPGCNLKRLTWHNENIRYEGDEFIHGRHWPAIGKALHPGFKGKQMYAVLRWTSLVEGDVSVHGTFTGYPKAKGGNGVRVVIFVDG
ncbi:MAG: hypothetical protein KDA66_05405, partial [Planctomycetaceae bacterium]|nr:hypothetical protein [Planctomycetaceae bacterium]